MSLRNTHFAFLLIWVFFLANVSAEDRKEYDVKAAFIFTFLKYTDFPDKGTHFNIAIIGKNPFKGALKEVSKEKVKGREVKVSYFNRDVSKETLSKFHIIFISSSEFLSQKDILKKITGPHSLTIGDNKWFLKSGGMINFITKNKSIRWQVNTDQINTRKFKVSSKILRLAIK